MKPLLHFAVSLATFVLAAAGCSPKDDFVPVLEIARSDGTTLAGTSIEYSASGAETTIRITCNGAWTIGCEASWLSFTAHEGRGDAEVTLTADAAESSRSAVVTISMPDFVQMRRAFDAVQRVNPKPEQPEEPDNPDTPEEPDEPDGPEVADMTIRELNGLFPESESSTVADPERDIRFDALVQNDFSAGNYPSGQLFLADADADADADAEGGRLGGVSLAGMPLAPAEYGLESGRRITVTLHAGRALLVNRGGMRCVTGEGDWVTIERQDVVERVEPCLADPSCLQDYRSMTVAIPHACAADDGVWCTIRDGVHEFVSSGVPFEVYVRAEADGFADKRFCAHEHTIVGIVTVHDGRVRLYPRNTGDVAEFDCTEPEPVPPAPISIPDLIAAAAADGPTLVDAECDRIFTAVVMNDIEGNNFDASHLILSSDEDSAAHNGIVVAGAAVAPSVTGLGRGDRVSVILRAGLCSVINYKGMYELTGDSAREWIDITVMGAGHDLPPVDIAARDMASYQSMAVRLRGVKPQSGGVWHSPEGGGFTTFATADGEEFEVFVSADAAFASDGFHAVEGDLYGLSRVIPSASGGRVCLCPRNAADVAAFANGPAEPTEPVDPSQPSEPSQPDEPTDPVDPSDPAPDPAPDDSHAFAQIASTAALAAGEYYLGGYRDGRLFLASGGVSSAGHGNTAEYVYTSAGDLSPAGAESAASVVLESADIPNGYHVRFVGYGYLTASASGAGKLMFSPERRACWMFSDDSAGGLDVRSTEGSGAKLIISQRAPRALLRSVAADEEGNPIVLFRHRTKTE